MKKPSIKSDLPRIDRMLDADIDYSDIPPLDKTFCKVSTIPLPLSKKKARPSARRPRALKPKDPR